MLPYIEKPTDRWKEAKKKCEQTKLPRIATNGWRQKLSSESTSSIRDNSQVNNKEISLNAAETGKQIAQENNAIEIVNTEDRRHLKLARIFENRMNEERRRISCTAKSVEIIIQECIDQKKKDIEEKKRKVESVKELMRKYPNDDAHSSFKNLIETYAKSCLELSSINCSLYSLREVNVKNMSHLDEYEREFEEVSYKIGLEKERIEKLDIMLKSVSKKST